MQGMQVGGGDVCHDGPEGVNAAGGGAGSDVEIDDVMKERSEHEMK